jgi:hypothetical protein
MPDRLEARCCAQGVTAVPGAWAGQVAACMAAPALAKSNCHCVAPSKSPLPIPTHPNPHPLTPTPLRVSFGRSYLDGKASFQSSTNSTRGAQQANDRNHATYSQTKAENRPYWFVQLGKSMHVKGGGWLHSSGVHGTAVAALGCCQLRHACTCIASGFIMHYPACTARTRVDHCCLTTVFNLGTGTERGILVERVRLSLLYDVGCHPARP